MNDTCHFNDALGKTTANHVPLSPLSFIKRAASVYPDAGEGIDAFLAKRKPTWVQPGR